MSRLLRITMIVAVLAAAVAGCGVVAGAGDDGLVIDAHFDRTFNLFEGSRVRIVGVDVGQVESVTVPEGGTHVVARLHLDPGVEVPEDATAAIIQGALLGERYVQLFPAYEGGPTIADGATIPLERTATPVEFEESFDALSEALETLDPDEVARLVVNLSGTLDGHGEDLGQMLESVRDLISSLRDSDEELVELAVTLADLNETIGTRAEEITQQYANLGRLAESLASERAGLRGTLEALNRMTFEVGTLLETHRPTLEEDLQTLSRLTRTLERNLDLWPRYLEGQAEVYRHTARGVASDERNWSWTRNHYDAIPILVAHRVQQRLVGLCLRLEIEECADPEFWAEGSDDELCLPPLIPCPGDDEDEMRSVAEELQRALETIPELEERLLEEQEEELDDAFNELHDSWYRTLTDDDDGGLP